MQPLPRVLLAASSGVLLAASQPLMFGHFDALAHGVNGLLAFVALVPWLWSLRRAPWSQAAALTFVTSFVHFALSLHWLYHAIHGYGGLPVTSSLFAIFVLCSVFSAVMAPAGAVVAFTWDRLPLWLVAPLAWAGAELGRTVLFTGFPWSSLATTQWAFPIAQTADLVGLSGIHVLVVAVNVAWLPATRRTGAWIAGGLLLASVGYGLVREPQVEREYETSEHTLRVGLLQGNIGQAIKHDRAHQDEIVAKYNMLARDADARGADLIVWPEAALPHTMHRNTMSFSKTKLYDETHAQHLIGVATYWHDTNREDDEPSLANSAFLVDGNRRVEGRYDKVHLVPFGEYVPIPLPGLTHKIVAGRSDYTPGTPTLLSLRDGTPIGVLICFEAVFPSLSRRAVRDGAQILVNITNDAWPGRSSGAVQHLVLARYRAIETRRPLVRAANTGISAIITPSGRIAWATEIDETVVVVDDVHEVDTRSPYVVLGDTFGWAAAGSLILFPLAAVFLRRRERPRP